MMCYLPQPCFSKHWLLTANDGHAEPDNGSDPVDNTPRTRLETMMSPAPASEVEALLQRWSALVRSAGLTDAESIAGWQGSHGRKRRTVGHIRAVLSRARVTQKACSTAICRREIWLVSCSAHAYALVLAATGSERPARLVFSASESIA